MHNYSLHLSYCILQFAYIGIFDFSPNKCNWELTHISYVVTRAKQSTCIPEKFESYLVTSFKAVYMVNIKSPWKHSCSKCGFETNRKLDKTSMSKNTIATWKFNLKETPKTELVVSVQLCISRRQHYYATLIVGVHPLQCPTCRQCSKTLVWNVDTCRKVGVKLLSANASDQASVHEQYEQRDNE
jgi:predicted RNA-binding Zn-ribbon protein involved in translation (DUF1610 family)